MKAVLKCTGMALSKGKKLENYTFRTIKYIHMNVSSFWAEREIIKNLSPSRHIRHLRFGPRQHGNFEPFDSLDTAVLRRDRLVYLKHGSSAIAIGLGGDHAILPSTALIVLLEDRRAKEAPLERAVRVQPK